MEKSLSILILLVLPFCNIHGQNKSDSNYNSEFIEVNGIKTHYLDFGGEGLPIILVHSEAWSAFTFQNFGQLLTEHNKVLAITRSGYGDSGMGDYDVESQGNHLIAFADAMKIKKAVFVGNASVTAELTYLAENYPQRVAGVIYLNGLSVPWIKENYEDPTHAFEMFLRASPSSNPEKTDFLTINKARRSYRPKHYISDSIKINVPALAIVSRNGRQGSEKGLGALVYVGSPLMEDVRNEIAPSRTRDMLDRLADDPSYRRAILSTIQDSIAREYFLELDSDTVKQKRMYQYHMQVVYPAILEAQDKLINAYGDNIKLQKIEVAQIVGYEYRDSPELIIDPILNFINHLSTK
ncbi:alpha/beta hydrolase [Flagellimonas halotolerans]|uniref:Alpha/beta hydrolase n=1 Tax=Flagellimonas halotolerans TaxID=3112164 RepID=A0ABU6IQ46_9FLAO|nr:MULTISPECIES: alpha/beta hydrolase [unclassified Allomuricauda]MEC3965283.1 alpha/beta hydrolase [Muricauda sp. SYSU M86414]MEC4265149.1 alpha/beta hydrolase [Muricauda sp. SYSU M84420]